MYVTIDKVSNFLIYKTIRYHKKRVTVYKLCKCARLQFMHNSLYIKVYIRFIL